MLPRICLYVANQPDAVYVYVNIRNYSSFVVFYFVFVL